MAYTIAAVSSSKRAELDAVLKDDQIARQSHKIRDAAAIGGPSGEIYVQIDGAAEVVQRAQEMLGQIGTVLPAADREKVHAQFVSEDDAASAGMGLFFTEE
ncbi:MAG: hypothetical protein ACREB9_04480 [Thermoplasmata archaeon]